jgi:hypothetical protein
MARNHKIHFRGKDSIFKTDIFLREKSFYYTIVKSLWLCISMQFVYTFITVFTWDSKLLKNSKQEYHNIPYVFPSSKKTACMVEKELNIAK